jgi:hypothetical protein
MRKPQDYKQAAVEQCFFLLVLCLPYYQALLFAGISGMISVLLMAFLLMFVVAGSPEIYRTIAALLKDFPLAWFPPIVDRRGLWVLVPLDAVANEPSLAPSFQRPPPIFS